jgi:hypothetical protein
MIGAINAYSTAQTGGASAFNAASAVERTSDVPESQSITPAQTGSTLTISTLARQLADSAKRAEERDNTLSRSELADKAKIFFNESTAEADPSIQAKHDSEVPKTEDPELLARAKQATAFLVGMRHGGSGEKSPFSELSREQLANIMYDDSGAYTFNERAAASTEAQLQEEVWRVKVIAKALDEYNGTGKLTNFFSSVLDHFKELPPIEQAQYPKDYASDLESKIKLNFNYRTHHAEGKGEDPISLIDTLFKQNLKQSSGELYQAQKYVDSSTTTSPAIKGWHG